MFYIVGDNVQIVIQKGNSPVPLFDKSNNLFANFECKSTTKSTCIHSILRINLPSSLKSVEAFKMNKEEEVELRLAARNHGACDSEFDSDSSSGRSDFDEEYEIYKPPSISLHDRKYDIVKIGAFETVIHKRPKVKRTLPKLPANKSAGSLIQKKRNKQTYNVKMNESDNKNKFINGAKAVKSKKKIKEQNKCSTSFSSNISQTALITNTDGKGAVSRTIVKPLCKNQDVGAKRNIIYISNAVGNNSMKATNVKPVGSINDNQCEIVPNFPIQDADLNKQNKILSLEHITSSSEGFQSVESNAGSIPMCPEVTNSEHATSGCVPYSNNLETMPDFKLKSQGNTNLLECCYKIVTKKEIVNTVALKNCKKQKKLPCESGLSLCNCTKSSGNTTLEKSICENQSATKNDFVSDFEQCDSTTQDLAKVDKQLVVFDNHDSKINKPKLASELKKKNKENALHGENNGKVYNDTENVLSISDKQLSAALTINQDSDSMKASQHEFNQKLSKKVNKKKSCSNLIREQSTTPNESVESYVDMEAQNQLQGSKKNKSGSRKKRVTKVMSHNGTNIEQSACNRNIQPISETREEKFQSYQDMPFDIKLSEHLHEFNKIFEIWFMNIVKDSEKLGLPLVPTTIGESRYRQKLKRKLAKKEFYDYWLSTWYIANETCERQTVAEQVSQRRGVLQVPITETNFEECLINPPTFDDKNTIISQKEKRKKKRSRRKKNLDADDTQMHLKCSAMNTFSDSNYKTDLKNRNAHQQLALIERSKDFSDIKIDSIANKEAPMNTLQISEINYNCKTVALVASPKYSKYTDVDKNALEAMQLPSSSLHIKRGMPLYNTCDELSYPLFNLQLKPKVSSQDCEVTNIIKAQPILFYFIVMALRRLNNL